MIPNPLPLVIEMQIMNSDGNFEPVGLCQVEDVFL